MFCNRQQYNICKPPYSLLFSDIWQELISRGKVSPVVYLRRKEGQRISKRYDRSKKCKFPVSKKFEGSSCCFGYQMGKVLSLKRFLLMFWTPQKD